jgi:hypothetical protein
VEAEAFEAEVAKAVQAWTAGVDASAERVVAIQASWDGDDSGWDVEVELVVAIGAGFEARRLARVKDVELVEMAGPEVARARGLDFYFPAPEGFDHEVPRWWERETATTCRSCGKRLRLDRHQGSVPDHCDDCERRERRQRALVEDRPGRDANVFFLIVDGDGSLRSRMSLLLGHSHAGLVAELTTLLAARARFDARIDTVLSAAEVAELVAWCARSVDERLGEYRPRSELPEWVTRALPLEWLGEEHMVDTGFNEIGAMLWSLVAFHKLFSGCVAPATMHVFGNGGVTERDAAFLGLAAAHGAGATIVELRAAFPFLAEDAIEATLAKLAARGFVTRSGERYDLLVKGYGVSIAGPA